ncbi:MAG TPA: efflux RND transporter periplasmic adaptor subunit [Burkholderiales bacterium]|nr:efflux RND transporter periplasmic adaptor subunit [Burkholderiales bacterium]
MTRFTDVSLRAVAQRILPVALPAVLAACGQAGSQPQGQMLPPEVAVIVAEEKRLPVAYEYAAQTAGYREVEVRARVTGIMLKRNYREGELVKRGQSLFQLDPAPFQVALARAEADLATAEAKQAQATRDADRMKSVIDIKAVSRKEYDDSVSGAQIAAAEVKGARARVAEAKLNLDWTRVEAPINGVSSRSLRSEGTLVSGPDVLLTTVTQTDPIYVIFGIPEAELLRIRRDVDAKRLQLPADGRFDVTLTLSDGTVYGKPGQIDFTDARVSTSTGTVEARAELPNAAGMLRPGQFVRARLTGAVRPAAITIPQRAVLEGPQGKFVYVVDAEGKAQPHPVQVGDWTGDAWVIDSGVAAGDKVIVDGVMKIGPGAPVRIAAPAQPGDQKAAAPGAAKSDAKK